MSLPVSPFHSPLEMNHVQGGGVNAIQQSMVRHTTQQLMSMKEPITPTKVSLKEPPERLQIQNNLQQNVINEKMAEFDEQYKSIPSEVFWLKNYNSNSPSNWLAQRSSAIGMGGGGGSSVYTRKRFVSGASE